MSPEKDGSTGSSSAAASRPSIPPSQTSSRPSSTPVSPSSSTPTDPARTCSRTSSANAWSSTSPLDERYSRTAGAEVNLNDIRASIEILIGSGVSHEFRTTVCPPFHTDDDILGAALAIRGASHYYLQNFRPINTLDPSLAEVKPYTGEEMRRLAALAAPFVRHCAVRGDPGSAITRKA